MVKRLCLVTTLDKLIIYARVSDIKQRNFDYATL